MSLPKPTAAPTPPTVNTTGTNSPQQRPSVTREIEDFMNWLSDMDWAWWPVVSLRPQKDREIDNRVLLRISPIFGSAAGILAFTWLVVIARLLPFTSIGLLTHVLIGCVGFFVVYKISFASFWNRRARRLRGGGTRQPGAGQDHFIRCRDASIPSRTIES